MIVAMTRRHIPEIMKYEDEVFGTEAWTRSAYLEQLALSDNRAYLVAEDDGGALQGTGGVRVLGDEAEIMTVGVIPSAQGRGIGGELVQALLDEAARRGAAVVFLEVRTDNAAAHRLYEKHGFARIGIRRGYYDNGRIDAITMRRDLP